MAKTKVTGGYIADSAITPDHLHTSLDISSKTLTIGATTVSGHLIPSANITYDLGSSTYRFRDIYLDGNTIDLGGTELKKNSDGDIEFKSGTNFKKLVISELEFDDGTNRKKFKISSGRIKSFDSSGVTDTADKISLASNTTDDLGEGSSNLYFTTARARGAISASTGIAITDGAISAAAVPNASLTNSSVTINSNSLSLGGTLTLDTDDIGEGLTNLYFTNARARGAISVSGNALSYNSSTGVLTANYEESPSFTGNVTISGYVSSAGAYFSDTLRVLNSVGDGWNNWATRSAGNFNLSVGTISSGAITSTGAIQGTSFSDGTISGITFIDEDTFATNSATRVPTQQSIKAYVDAQVAGVVDSAPAALNTLNELAAALGDDANFSTTTSTALGNRLRVDTASQGLTGTQQANAITNLGITATKAELNYVDGVTSNIQTQLNTKITSSDNITGTSAGLTGTPNITVGTISSGAITSSSSITTQAASASAGIKIKRTNSSTAGARGYIGFMDSDNNFVASIDSRATGVNNSGDLRFTTSTGEAETGVYNLTPVLTLGTDQSATFAGSVSGVTSYRNSNGAEIIDSNNSTYTILKNYTADSRIWLGETATYLNNTNYYFRDTGSNHLLTLNSSGLNIRTAAGGLLIEGQEVIDGSRNLTNIGTISSGSIDSSGNIDAEGKFIVQGAGTLLELNASGWNVGNQTHDILYNGWTSATGDYIYLSAAGNSNTGCGTLLVTDGAGFYYGAHSSQGAITASATDPLSDVKFRVDGSGNITEVGNITTQGNIIHDSVVIDDYSSGTVAITVGRLQIKSPAKTGWAVGDELGAIEFYNSDASGIGARNAARIVAENNNGNGSTTTTFEGELAFYTSAYNSNLNASPALLLDSSNNATFAGTISSGNIVSTGELRGTTVRIQNTSNSTKYGLSLYGSSPTNPTYGIMFTGTAGSGTHGSVTGDWATYFTMNSSTGRGWIFRQNSTPTNVASISNTGNATFNGTVTASGGNSGNWNTAYGWGNHASAGYITSVADRTPLDHIRSLGTQAFTGTSTTAGFISEMESDGAFDSYSSVFKTSWSYAGNFNISDAGTYGPTETAGMSFLTWTDNSSDSTRGNITVLAIAPNTGGSGGRTFIYNDQGSSYNPGWREIWTSRRMGSGTGLDADKLDAQEGSYYLNYNNFTNTPTIPTNNNQLTNGAGYITSADGGNASTLTGSTWGSFDKNVGADNFYVEAGDGRGLRFWDGNADYNIYMSQDGASGAGNIPGLSVADYNMYFRMSGGTNRGFAFQDSTGTPHSGIDSSGNSAFYTVRSNKYLNSTSSPRYDCSFYVLQSQHWYGQTSSQSMYLGESGNSFILRGTLHVGSSTTAPSGYDMSVTGNMTMNDTHLHYCDQVHGNRARLNYYYDKGNTFLFRTGSSTGTTRSLNLWNSTADPSQADNPAGTGITWGQRSDNNPYYIIYPDKEDINGNYAKLVIAWHTGIKIGAASSYGGTRFYNNSPFLGSEIFSIGNGDNHLRIATSGKLFFNGNTTYGIGAGGHNMNSGYFDTVESGLSTDTLELVYYSGVGVNVGSGGGKPLGCSEIRFNANTTNRKISSTSAFYSTHAGVRIHGNWNEFEVMGRVLDVSGSNCHFMDGYGSTNHASHYMRIGSGGGGNGGLDHVHIGCNLNVAGNVTAYYSDARLKQNVETIPNALEILREIRGVTFEWNKTAEGVWNKKEGEKDFGMIAQEVDKVFPMGTIVQGNADRNKEIGYADPNSPNYDPLHNGELDEPEYKTIKYDKMVTLAIQAIKEQQEIIEKLTRRIDELENKGE